MSDRRGKEKIRELNPGTQKAETNCKAMEFLRETREEGKGISVDTTVIGRKEVKSELEVF